MLPLDRLSEVSSSADESSSEEGVSNDDGCRNTKLLPALLLA